jgi:FSR family fosmidomycin resistance protein-like MFS transporter
VSSRSLERPLLVAVTIAILHGFNDAYSAFLHPLLPRIMAKLDLSITLAATLTMTLALAASLAQPALGHLADRGGQRWLVLLGPIAMALFLSSIGLAPNLGVLLVLLVLGGLGSAAFHPPGATMAVRAGDPGRGGTRHAIFSFGGATGYAAGPLIAVSVVQWRGLEGLWIAMLPMIFVVLIVHRILPAYAPRAHSETSAAPARITELLAGPLGVVFAISALCAFLQRLFLTLDPIIVAEAGGSETRGALLLTAYLGGQAVGTLSGGLLADRLDRRGLLAALTLLSLPTHILAFLHPIGALGLAFAAAAGAVNQATLPPLVVMAVEIAPKSAGLASGVVMGLAWAAGSIGVLGAGALADVIGPQVAGAALVPTILVAAALAFHPWLRAHSRPALGAPTIEAPVV